jgi:hypothetical protein
MNALDKRQSGISAKGLETKEGARRRLSSNGADTRVPSLGFNPNHRFVSTDAALDYLAEILVGISLENNAADNQESRDLLPSLDQRAG